VILNLVSNAVKFTDEGAVEVQVVQEEFDRDGVRLAFTVRDTGIGIAPEAREALFSPFTQADSSMARRFGGTGLGLAISQRLVELMGGSIALMDGGGIAGVEGGQGSAFRFVLPFLPAQRQQAEEADCEMPPASLPRPPETYRLLLAEDNSVNRLVATRLLQGMGFRVDTVTNGVEALDALAGGGYDLVLMVACCRVHVSRIASTSWSGRSLGSSRAP